MCIGGKFCRDCDSSSSLFFDFLLFIYLFIVFISIF